jgi:hypothetical protein
MAAAACRAGANSGLETTMSAAESDRTYASSWGARFTLMFTITARRAAAAKCRAGTCREGWLRVADNESRV